MKNAKKIIPLLLALVMLVLPLTVSAGEGKTPVMSWSFDKGNEGFTLTNVERVKDSRGYALKFSGTGANTQGVSAATLATDAFSQIDWVAAEGATVSLWVKPDANIKGWLPLFNLVTYIPEQSSQDNHGFLAVLSTGELAVNTTGNSVVTGFQRGWVNPATDLSTAPCVLEAGKWSQVTLAIGKDTIVIYVNGQKYADGSINELTPHGLAGEFVFTKEFQLGSWKNVWWQAGDFQGMLDDVNVYTGQLSATQVEAAYNAEKAKTASPDTSDASLAAGIVMAAAASVIVFDRRRRNSK